MIEIDVIVSNDTDDREWLVKSDGTANDIRVTPEPLLPKTLADHRDPICSRLVVFRRNRSSKDRVQSHRVEESAGDLGTVQSHWRVAEKIKGTFGVSAYRLKGRTGLPIHEIGW